LFYFPVGLVSNQKSQFGYILERLEREDVGLFYGHFAYFKVIWYILWPFGVFSRFVKMYIPRKIGVLTQNTANSPKNHNVDVIT
jgi:hypothetical protein